MPSERFEMRVPGELLKRLDAARGFEPRASFVKRALESALDGSSVPVREKGPATPSAGNMGPAVPARVSPVSSRAPVEKEPENHARPGSADAAGTATGDASRPASSPRAPSLKETWGR